MKNTFQLNDNVRIADYVFDNLDKSMEESGISEDAYKSLHNQPMRVTSILLDAYDDSIWYGVDYTEYRWPENQLTLAD